jgi:hypothetical protein
MNGSALAMRRLIFCMGFSQNNALLNDDIMHPFNQGVLYHYLCFSIL